MRALCCLKLYAQINIAELTKTFCLERIKIVMHRITAFILVIYFAFRVLYRLALCWISIGQIFMKTSRFSEKAILQLRNSPARHKRNSISWPVPM